MFTCKSNKQALIISILATILCFTCLTGATFALFTNDPDDGTIGVVVTSGDVEVDIVDTSDVTLQNRAMSFMNFSGDEGPAFEPGATFYTQGFQVKNTGNIPVNFTLSVSKDENIDMQEFEEAFEVWIVRADDKSLADAERLTSFKGSLKAGDSSEIYHLYIRMKETANNEFQGKIYTGIGVTVYAVQGNVNIGE